jgi:hypothetical protein
MSGWAAAAAGGLGIAADIYSARQTNKMNMAIAREQMAFQERMASTAHQREVADLKAAGLNPVLSATKGQGAATPGGASIAVQNPMADLGRKMSKTVASALEFNRMKEDVKNVKQNTDTAKAVETKTKADTKATEINNQIAKVNKKIVDAQLPAAKAQAQYQINKSKIEGNPILMWTNAITNAVGQGIGNVIQPIRDIFTGKGNKNTGKKYNGGKFRPKPGVYRNNKNAPF